MGVSSVCAAADRGLRNSSPAVLGGAVPGRHAFRGTKKGMERTRPRTLSSLPTGIPTRAWPCVMAFSRFHHRRRRINQESGFRGCPPLPPVQVVQSSVVGLPAPSKSAGVVQLTRVRLVGPVLFSPAACSALRGASSRLLWWAGGWWNFGDCGLRDTSRCQSQRQRRSTRPFGWLRGVEDGGMRNAPWPSLATFCHAPKAPSQGLRP